MIPRLCIEFQHRPFQDIPVKIISHDYTLEFSDALHEDYLKSISSYDEGKPENQEEEAKRFTNMMELAAKILDPTAQIQGAVSSILAKDVPVTNAFLKLFEMLHFPDVMSYIMDLESIHCVFLADFPGTFIVATNYFLALKKPALIIRKRYTFHATSLPPESGEALKDDYGLYKGMPDKWVLMDHTSYEDTQKMRSIIKDGSADFVTGDIGKPIRNWKEQEHEMFLEEYGQLISALLVLRQHGVGILKMFQAFYAPTVCMLRLVQVLFEKVYVIKPVTSRITNNEVYWILIDFKRELFEPILDSLLSILQKEEDKRKTNINARGNPFIPKTSLEPEFLDTIYTMGKGKNLRNIPYATVIAKLGLELYKKNLPYGQAKTYAISKRIPANDTVKRWMLLYPIKRIPDILKVYSMS